jgi:crossover junction endodeoxyribonuclease RusA
VLAFRAAGIPSTQGNLRAVTPKGAKFARIIDSRQDRIIPWRNAVQIAAADAAGPTWQPIPGPVRVDLWFALTKPAGAPKRRRTWPIGQRSGDVDKLARACLDAITDAGVICDDAQVVELRVVKDYPEHVQQLSPGVIVRVWRADEPPPGPPADQIPLIGQEQS